MKTMRALALGTACLLHLVRIALAAEPLGVIEATVAGKYAVDRFWAVDPISGRHIEGKVTGGKTLRAADLPLGTYGLVLKCGNHVVEGLRLPDEIYLGNDLEGADRKAFRDEVLAQETFFDQKTIWSIQGGHKRAVAFVFNERFKSWYDNPTGLEIKDVIIRRYDVQMMRKSGVAWVQDQLFFLWREMIQRDQAKPMTHEYSEQLAGFVLTPEQKVAKRAIKF